MTGVQTCALPICVYDTQTGEIYRAEAGWYESTGSDRYKPVTENKMYAEPISGYIE